MGVNKGIKFRKEIRVKSLNKKEWLIAKNYLLYLVIGISSLCLFCFVLSLSLDVALYWCVTSMKLAGNQTL